MCVCYADPWRVHGNHITRSIKAVDKARRTLDAVQLVKLGARASLVCQLTGLSRELVHELYRVLTGKPSPPGQVPFTEWWYLRSNRRLLHANVVWRLFRYFERSDSDPPSTLIHVFEAYIESVDEPVLSVARAFFVPRLLLIKAWCERRCQDCGGAYVGPVGRREAVCPACTAYFRHRCRGCGAALACYLRGRPKALCAACYRRLRETKRAGEAGCGDEH